MKHYATILSLSCVLLLNSITNAQTPDAGTNNTVLSTTQLIRGFSRMEPAAFRALLPPEGLQVCSAQDLPHQGAISRRQRCQTKTAEQLTDAVVRRMLRAWAFGPVGSGGRLLPSSLRCVTRNGEEECRANLPGPVGSRWFFRGTGADRRLIRVLDWSLQT